MPQAVGWQRIEGAILFAVGLAAFLQVNDSISWWGALLIFFAPDLSFVGYLFGAAVGAVVYNMTHIYAFGATVLVAGLFSSVPILVSIGILWFAHSAFDRALGYGLKLPDGFSETHLGRIGRES